MEHSPAADEAPEAQDAQPETQTEPNAKPDLKHLIFVIHARGS